MLGRIELQNGTPTLALRYFDDYLRVAPAGPLVQEVWYGRAEAFRRLGLRKEAVETLRTLLRNYPETLYKMAIEEQLRTLGDE
jgi:outer membrane protein assembly factor BamD (BamD/ComL family)